MNNIKHTKGITLVALVITIILLLILTGITISTLSQNGLLEKAKLAKEKSEDAQKLENETLGEYQEYITGSSRNTNIKPDYSNAFHPFEEEKSSINPTEYVATCDGLLVLNLYHYNYGYVSILINDIVTFQSNSATEIAYPIQLIVNKGDTLKFTYSGNASIVNPQFCWMIPNK